jgi:VCBS repeat protein
MIYTVHHMKAGRTPLATALVVVAAMLSGCGPFFGPASGPRAPEIDPPAGTYNEQITVSITNSEGQLYVSTDPSAGILEYKRYDENEPIQVADDMTVLAYCIDEQNLRSPVSRADYVIESTDATAPTIASAELWQSSYDYFGYDIQWDVWPPDGAGGNSNPSDDITDWYNLEFIVYASPEDNIDTLEKAESGGLIVRDWHSENAGSGVGYAHYEASAAGERRYINVFVRDQAGNASSYGSVRMQSRTGPPDIYLGRLAPPVDDVWLNQYSGEFDPPFIAPPDPVPALLENTYVVALADLNDDGFDDLIACYETGGTTYQGWFAAKGNGSFEDSPTHVLDSTGTATDIEIADMDQDGSPDIVFADNSATVKVYHSDLTLLMTAGDPDTDWISTGDVNGDGFPDLVTGDVDNGLGVGVWINNGGALVLSDEPWYGEITNPTTDVLFANLNQDEYADLIIAQDTTAVELYYGNGSSQMVPEVDEILWWPYEKTVRLAAADWNQDGWTDLVFANDTTALPWVESRLYMSDGDPDMDSNPEFTSPVALPSGTRPSAVQIVDLNDDNWPDLIETLLTAPGIMWLNTDGSGFTPGGTPIGTGDESCLAVGRLK